MLCLDTLDFISLVLSTLTLGCHNLNLTNDIHDILACDENARNNFAIKSNSESNIYNLIIRHV